ncbi:MAG: hypothetical protein M0Q91_06245 [Methanoregula sp.]|nr:hypothetical protein [Methanoregula sp.]
MEFISNVLQNLNFSKKESRAKKVRFGMPVADTSTAAGAAGGQGVK